MEEAIPMNIDFNKWWDEDDLTTQVNPFSEGTAAYWAWEGWCAGVKAERRDMMQLFTDPENQPTQHGTVTLEYMQREIAAERKACERVAGLALLGAEMDLAKRVLRAIRARSNT